MVILISACLLGIRCRYDGCAKTYPQAVELCKSVTFVPVCPEQLGGLPTPRPPCEIKDGQVRTEKGDILTAAYEQGAREVLRIAQLLHCSCALLKERSPSCGSGIIHDGTFSGGLTEGKGITAALLTLNGIPVFGESQCKEIFNVTRYDDTDSNTSHSTII